MKIGQVTMYGDNYGACLQAYALQQVIKNKGHDIKLVKYHQATRNSGGGSSKIQRIMRLGVAGTIKYFRERKYIELRKNAYKQFRNQCLEFQEGEWYRDDDLTKLNEEFDAFVCGSDMIWSEEFSEDWDFFFLNFAIKEKCFTYAPSFGKNQLSNRNKTKVAEYLKDIRRIACRENAGANLVRSLGRSDAIQVLDPTMLLTKEEWCERISDKSRIIEEPFVFAYLFGDATPKRKEFFNRVDKQIGKMCSLPKFTKKEQNAFPVQGIGPWDYLRLFRDAEFIVTDTFHGLMFSIIFRKPFVVLKRTDGSNWAKYSDRMTSTLEMFGLSERYIEDTAEDLSIYKNLDYNSYEEIISSKRLYSLDYIDSILDGEK